MYTLIEFHIIITSCHVSVSVTVNEPCSPYQKKNSKLGLIYNVDRTQDLLSLGS